MVNVVAAVERIHREMLPHRTTCGEVASKLMHALTGCQLSALDQADRKGKTVDLSAIRKPARGKAIVVGLSLINHAVNHQMTFAITADGRVRTVQAYAPVMQTANAWSLGLKEFGKAVRRLACGGARWDDSFSDAFDTLTRIRDFRKVRGGSVLSAEPVVDAIANNAGAFLLFCCADKAGRGAGVPKLTGLVMEVDDESQDEISD